VVSKKLIDISLPILPGMIVWPGSRKVEFKKWKRMDKGDRSNDTEIYINVHTGTHIDAPRHFIKDGKTIDQIQLKRFIGKVYVVEIMGVNEITAKDLSGAGIPISANRILCKTDNSQLWLYDNGVFFEDFVAFTADAAQWLIDRKVELVGIDYLSVQKYKDHPEVHRKLLGAGVTVLEGLNLHQVKPGYYTLFCFPLKLVEVEASFVRAVLYDGELK